MTDCTVWRKQGKMFVSLTTGQKTEKPKESQFVLDENDDLYQVQKGKLVLIEKHQGKSCAVKSRHNTGKRFRKKGGI